MKKFILVALIIGGVVFAVKGVGVIGTLKREFQNARHAIRGDKSEEDQIKELRKEVDKLDKDIDKAKDALANEIVEVRDLTKQSAKLRAEVTNEEKRVLAFSDDLKTTEGQIAYGREMLSIPDAKDRLKSDVSLLVRKKNTASTMEKTLSHRERSKELLEKQLAELTNQKQTLKSEVDAIEVEYQNIKLQQMENKYQKDDSRLSSIKQSIEKMRKDLEVKKERIKLDPVGQPVTGSSESVEDILKPLSLKADNAGE